MQNIYNSNEDCQDHSPNNQSHSPNVYQLSCEFLSDCDDFIHNINNVKNSPWINDGIVRWARVEQKITLSPIQEVLVRFLQRTFFRKGAPCFVKQSHIANKLQIHRTQVNRALAALEKKGLIVRITWLYKERRKRTIILPLLPSIKHLFNKDTCLVQTDFQDCHIKRDNLFCKPSESKDFEKSYILYTNILYINRISNNIPITVDSILFKEYIAKAIGVFEETPDAAEPVLVNQDPPDLNINKEHMDSNKEETPLVEGCRVQVLTRDEIRVPVNALQKEDSPMVQKFLLKCQERSKRPHVHQPIFDQLKRRSKYEFDDLATGDQIELNSYIDYFHGINVRDHFRISPTNKNKGYDKHARMLRKQLMYLIANKHQLQWDYADKVLEYWNNAEVHRSNFQRMRLNNKGTKAYKSAVIAISYVLIKCAGSRLNALFKAIDRLVIAADSNIKKVPFTWRSNITAEKFFANLDDQYMSGYIASSDVDFERFLYHWPVKRKHIERVNIGYSKFKHFYIDQFYMDNKEKGQQICYRFESLIKKWLEERIDEILETGKHVYRNMENYSLVEDRVDSEGRPLPPILQMYFFYINRRRGYSRMNTLGNEGFLDGYSMPKMTYILSRDLWAKFITDYMRTEVGLKNFYKRHYKN